MKCVRGCYLIDLLCLSAQQHHPRLKIVDLVLMIPLARHYRPPLTFVEGLPDASGLSLGTK
jgi:hypothetical protein